jgi:hypothetical protein
MGKNVCPYNNKLNKTTRRKFTRKETIEEATCATIKLHEADTVVPFKNKAGDKQRTRNRQSSKTVEEAPQSQMRRN